MFRLACPESPLRFDTIKLFTNQSRSYLAQTSVFNLKKNNKKFIEKSRKSTSLALEHFDGLYSKVYGKAWPSSRLALLSPKKYCAVVNSYHNVEEFDHENFMKELGAIDIQRYYKKHLISYLRDEIKRQILTKKREKKRAVMAEELNVSKESIDLETVEVSDISDSEIKGSFSDLDDRFSTAEDLQAMFSDRRLDEDEKYFINQASPELSLQDFVPATELIFHEETTNDLAYYEGYNPDIKLDVEYREEPYLNMIEELKIYSFPRNNWSQFPKPDKGSKSELLNYYMMDGASLLPVLALDLSFNDICADYCAAPGGKSLAMLMTLRPGYLQSNDNSSSRSGRMCNVIKAYVPDIKYMRSTLEVTNMDAKRLIRPDTFDKILLDVPCSGDRHSVEALENNIFMRMRTSERLDLPKKQSDMLRAALKSLKPKGSLVYSTCTLSPLENDGVVQRALIQLQEENFDARFAIVNLKESFRPFRGLFHFHTKFKYGQQVLPSVCSNYGPMYISKIKRLS